MLERLFGRRAAPDPPEPGGLAFSDLYPAHRPSGIRQASYGPPGRLVPATLDSTILAAANPARRSLAIVNGSATGNLFITLGPASSTSAYTIKVGPGATYVLEDPDIYVGDVAGVWDVASGAAAVTETFR